MWNAGRCGCCAAAFDLDFGAMVRLAIAASAPVNASLENLGARVVELKARAREGAETARRFAGRLGAADSAEPRGGRAPQRGRPVTIQ